jgi:4-amino-4-deoxy-L-arabinose transferase-like glycosyltransferase
MTAVALLSAWRLAHATTPLQELRWSLLLGASLAGAALAKNGFGLMVPGLTILGWFCWECRLPALLRWPWWAAAAICLLLAGGWLFALARQPAGGDLVGAVLRDNLVARLLPVQSHAAYDLGHRNSHWKYLVMIPLFVIPWTCALLAAVRWSSKASRQATPIRSAVRFCIASVVPSTVVLLLSYTSRDVYFSPALLCLPVLLALWFTTQSGSFTRSEQVLLRMTRLTAQVLAAMSAVVAIVVLALVRRPDAASIAVVVLLTMIGISATRLFRRASPESMHGIVTAIGMFLIVLGTLEALSFPTIDRAQNLRALVSMAAPQLRDGHVATYCADETIRATLDYALHLRLPNVCTNTDVAELLRDHGDEQLLVLLEPARSTQRVGQLFPAVASSREAENQRAGEQLVPAGLGLQQTVRWSAPGGRGYALYGRTHTHSG